jgi:Holliday junction resolvasome RuvABC endonuclease subunit
MILGLDVSSSKIGYSIIDQDKKLLMCEFKKFKTSTSLETRALEFHSTLLDLSKKFKISKVMIEAPFVAFGGGRSSAQTVATLQRFNGMISLLVPIVFDIESEMITPAAARKKQGIKVPRGENTKRIIIEWVSQAYPNDFIVELTRHGNPRPGTDDMADSVLVALAAL